MTLRKHSKTKKCTFEGNSCLFYEGPLLTCRYKMAIEPRHVPTATHGRQYVSSLSLMCQGKSILKEFPGGWLYVMTPAMQGRRWKLKKKKNKKKPALQLFRILKTKRRFVLKLEIECLPREKANTCGWLVLLGSPGLRMSAQRCWESGRQGWGGLMIECVSLLVHCGYRLGVLVNCKLSWAEWADWRWRSRLQTEKTRWSHGAQLLWGRGHQCSMYYRASF